MSQEDTTWRGLRTILVSILRSDAVYYQAPSKDKMTFPCIVFERTTVDTESANNGKYMKRTKYTVTYINYIPTDAIFNEILDLPMCSHDRDFVSDNLYHSVFTIYY